MSKRFQECNWVEKLWRYRYYMPIPFKWVYYSWFKDFVVIDIETTDPDSPNSDECLILKGRELWGILIGCAQIKMNWVWTSEEVFDGLDEMFKNEL